VTARGFTLIELLVAMLITAVMATIGYTALNQAAANRVQLVTQSKRLLEVQRGLRTLEEDIEMLVPRPVREPLGNGSLPALVAATANTTSSVATGSGVSTAPTTARTTVSNLVLQSQAILSLTRGSWANPAGLTRSEQQRVSYLLEGDRLVRYHLPVLDAAGELPAIRRELLSGVESIAFRYMDAGHSWQTNWQSGGGVAQARLPLMRERPVAVEVTLQLKDWGTIVRVFEVSG
jgi:general secretion pathway protein J